MANQFSRTQLIFGSDAMTKLYNSRVIVFGIGGVGGYVVEALVRSGVGAIDIVDDDKVCLTNLNRQIIALHSTIGQDKVDVAEKRILDINPECKVVKHKCFFLPETANQFDFKQYDYVVDCIDTVSGKIQIIMQSKQAGVPVISCMGAGNKIQPDKFQITDISKTSICPLARVMRRELKSRGIKDVKVLFSTEPAITPKETITEEDCQKKQIPGSNAFVPSVAGLMIAGEVIKDLIK